MSLKKKFAVVLGLAAISALAVAPAAIAGVVNSNHDMTFKYGAIDPKAGACSFCHVPHKAGGSKLWASAITTGTGWRSEVISNLCYTCHGSTTYSGAQEILPFGVAGKHGRTVATLTGFGDIAALPGTVPVSSTDSDLKCTSCHDVHANENRPFIRYMGAVGTFDFQAHCQTCHPNRANAAGRGVTNSIAATNGPAGAGNYSQHPTDVAIAAAGGRQETFIGTIAAQFGIVGGVQGIGTGGWNLGGHRNANLLNAGNMTCATCHAVHSNETANYAAADGAGNVDTDLALNYAHLEVLNPEPTVVSAAICTGCHANDAVMGPGSVGVSHPIDTLPGTWAIGGTALGAGFPTGALNPGKWGTSGAIVCQSCHDMHYGAPNTSLLRGTIDTPVATSNANCNACHAGTTMPNHHPAGVVNSAAAPVSRSTAFNWATMVFGTATATNAYAFGAGNIMTCGTCHGGAGAHNNVGGFPGLTSLNTASDMCVECHSTNPSQYTSTVNRAADGSGTVAMQASHYLGDILTAGYKRAANWTTTGLASKYGVGGTNGFLICESCHTLKLVSGVPTVSNNGAGYSGAVRGTADPKGHVGLLLEHNGNNNTVFNATNAGVEADMCTGCHGGSPTGGTAAAGTATHPTISMGMAASATAAIVTKVGTAAEQGTVSLIPGSAPANMVNCESCHRPHDAAAGSGALILEAAGTASTKIAGGAATVQFDRATGNGGARYAEEATFCNYCHSY